MKKVFLVLIAAAAGLSADAFVDNQYMTTEQFMVNTGYSAEMSKMMKVTNQDPYREVYVPPKDAKTIYQRAYGYFVPGSYTDHSFYNHSGSFNITSWNDL